MWNNGGFEKPPRAADAVALYYRTPDKEIEDMDLINRTKLSDFEFVRPEDGQTPGRKRKA